MELQHAIDQAHDLTRRLFEALEHRDLEVCNDLLELRGHAMVEFEEIHRSATESQRAACRQDLESLKRADELLQSRTQAMLAMVAGEFRGQLGLSKSGKNPAGREPIQACVDRKV